MEHKNTALGYKISSKQKDETHSVQTWWLKLVRYYSKFTIMIINSPKSSTSEKIDADRFEGAPSAVGPVVENVHIERISCHEYSGNNTSYILAKLVFN